MFDFIKTLQLTKIGYSGPVSIRGFILTNSHVFLKTSLPNKKALEIISIIGCSISLFAVLITMAVTLVFWRQLKSPRVKVLLNLCAVIASSCILVILEGSARNKEVCKILSLQKCSKPAQTPGRLPAFHSNNPIQHNVPNLKAISWQTPPSIGNLPYDDVIFLQLPKSFNICGFLV